MNIEKTVHLDHPLDLFAVYQIELNIPLVQHAVEDQVKNVRVF